MLDFKRVFIIFIIIAVIVGVSFAVYYFIDKKNGNDEITEYTPQEEISEEQMRQTIVSLYFKSGEELAPEARLVDVKDLIDNPYEEILKMLIEGPKNTSLERTIPDGSRINKITKEGEILIIDFSAEFASNNKSGEKEEKLIINSIVRTVTELTEINGIKILINGEANKSFQDEKVNFKNVFVREN